MSWVAESFFFPKCQNVSATLCLGGKMSLRHNVLVAKCLACKMSGCQNVSPSKCQSVKMLRCQKWVICKMSGAEMSENHHLSCISCHVSRVTCHLSRVILIFKLVELVGGGSVINGAGSPTFRHQTFCRPPTFDTSTF